MSSEPPTSAFRRAKRDEELTHKPEFKPSIRSASPARNAPPTPLLTAKEAAHYLRVSLSWLAKKRMSGDGPAYTKVGKSVCYLESALIEWIKSRRRLSTREQ
jgi:predicted DNA-binding transcriptional regulator AlpA